MAVRSPDRRVNDPIRLALIAAIEAARPGTSAYWAERIAYCAAVKIKAELGWLDIYEAQTETGALRQ